MATTDDDVLLLVGLGALFLMGGKSAAAAPPGGGNTPPQGPPWQGNPPGGGGGAPPGGGGGGGGGGGKPPSWGGTPPATPAQARARVNALVARANQKAALGWIPTLVRAGATQAEAEGLARWIGIESSGDPLAVSRLGERGLLQCSPATAKLVFTPSEWDMLTSKNTDRETHAKLALKQFRWHVKRAKLDATRPVTDRLWYAKAHHMRPADLRTSTLRPDAASAAAIVAAHATAPNEQIRLAAANVVAFGSPTPGAVATTP